MDVTVRPARPDDVEPVLAAVGDTWADHGGDYLPRVLERWVASPDPDDETLVAERDGAPVGVVRVVRLTSTEAWCGGLRVHPEYRGRGVARRLTGRAFAWARERGADVARVLVFSWNGPGLGAARGLGFEPVAEVRTVHPEPAADTGDDAGASVEAAWAFWRSSAACAALDGLGLARGEPWALAELTREDVAAAAADGGLVTVGDGDLRAVAVSTGESTVDGERRADYGAAAWTDRASAAALLGRVGAVAAAAGADRTRLLVPETARAVSDAAAAGVGIDDAPLFVLAADLSRR